MKPTNSVQYTKQSTRQYSPYRYSQDYYDVLSTFQEIAKNYPVLTKAQELDLIQQYRNDRTKLNELLFMHNIKLVMNLARKYINRSSSPADLLMNGAKGLMTAAEKFDIDRGIKFNTYATNWVFKYLLVEFYSKCPVTGVNAISLNNLTNNENDDREFIDNLTDNEGFDNYVRAVYAKPSAGMTPPEEIEDNEYKNIVNDVIKFFRENTDQTEIDNDIIDNNILSKKMSISEISVKNNTTVSFTNKRRRQIIDEFRSILTNKFNISEPVELLC